MNSALLHLVVMETMLLNNTESERAEEQDKGATEGVNGQQEVSDLNVKVLSKN